MIRTSCLLGFFLCSILCSGGLGQSRDPEISKLKDLIGLPESAQIVVAGRQSLPLKSPLNVYLAMGLDTKLRDLFIDRLDEWNKKDGNKHGRVDITTDLNAADVILARWADQQNASTHTTPRIVAGTGMRTWTTVPAYAYIIGRTEEAFVIIWREAGIEELGKTKNSGRQFRDRFIQMLKDRTK
jgi:hypothetical protein